MILLNCFQNCKICLDKNEVIIKSLVNMLKKFIIAMKFTSSKKVNDKFLMCNTSFLIA